MDVDESVKQAFYNENFLRLWPEARSFLKRDDETSQDNPCAHRIDVDRSGCSDVLVRLPV